MVTTRTMYDCKGINSPSVRRLFPDAEMIAMYVTGSFDVMWTQDEEEMWLDIPHVAIDQGNSAGAVPWAVVRDVETGAWAPGKAVDRSGWTAARPTIYCDRDTIPAVTAAGWKGDLWLAIPGYNAITPPVVEGCTVVAVQNTYQATYDSSIVYDPYWPFLQPSEDSVIYIPVSPTDDAFVPFPTGSFRGVMVGRDFVSDTRPAQIRVAVHSESKGWTVHHIKLTATSPTTINFTEPDTDCLSAEFTSGPSPVGVTLF
jgi:hypothetical protein